MPNNFVFFTLGDADFIHRQANFAALSVIARTDRADDISITVVTDKPEWYRWLGEHVTVVNATPEMLKDWRGPHDHFFRIKIKVLQYVAENRPGNVIFLDCDVVCTSALTGFFEQLDQGQSFMDEMAYILSQKSGSGKKAWRRARGNTYGKFTVDENSPMWNAGVVAVPAQLSRTYLADALECMDEMCSGGVLKTFLEQFALGLSLDRADELKPATEWFLHYWGNKPPWNAMIAAFFAKTQLKGLSLEDSCDLFHALPLDIPKGIKRTRMERIANSVSKRLQARDQRIAKTITEQLTS